ILSSVVLACLCLAVARPAWSYFDKGGVLGVGARPMGMGGAFVAVQDPGTDAIWWNPAGLVTLPRMEASGFFAPLLNGKEIYYSGAFVSPFMDDTAIGLEVTDLYYNTGQSDTDSSEYQYILSLATPLNVEKTVSIGINLKYDQVSSGASASLPPPSTQTINNDMSGLGIDVGALYQVPLPTLGKQINFGFLGQDLDTSLHDQSSGVDTTVPLLLQVGTAYYPDENLVFTCDFSFFNDQNIAGEALQNPLYDSEGDTINSLAPDQSRPHFGIEGWFFDGHLGLRAGYTGFATTPDQFTAGISYKQSWYGIDYAYMGHADYLGDSHRLELHVDFGGPAERPRVVALVNPPVNVVVRPDNNSVQLTWDANPDPHVTGYTVYMSKASGTDYTPIQKRMKDHRVVVDGLTNGVRYYFVVTSVNNSWPAVESTYSTEVSAVPSPQIPGAPTLGGGGSVGSSSANGEINVKGWGPPTGSIAGYNLYVSLNPDNGFKKLNSTPIKDSSYLAQGLDIGRRYYFMLTQVTSDSPPVESAPSAVWSMLSSEAPATAAPAGR
ncbi:MAG: fibronectin type III domain-containing protein, partial [bacterium]